VLQDAEGRVLTSVAQVEPGQELNVRVTDGRVDVVAKSTTDPEERR
jgi:exonuclease VII large subunit